MDHTDHVRLLRDGLPTPPGSQWADFGCGAGTIHGVDRDADALAQNTRRMAERFPAVTFVPHTADFTHPLDLPPLDGLVMANALHFHREQEPIVARLVGYLQPGVPYPVGFAAWQALAQSAGLTGVRQLATRPSRATRAIYSAAAVRGG